MDRPASVRAVARLVAQPDKVDQLRNLLAGAGARSRAIPGCRGWTLLHGRANKREFITISEWESAAAYEERMRAPDWVAITGTLPDLVEGEIGFDLYEVIG
jgi:quinol monooxygenase YgiN